MENSTTIGGTAPSASPSLPYVYINNINGSSLNFNDTYDNDSNSKQTWPPRVYLEPMDIIAIPLSVIIFILAVIGNLLVIVTLIQNKRMRTVTNVFLLNLSISDLLVAVLCMPFTLIPILLRNFIFGEFICISIRYLQAVAVSVSCFTLVAISLERYFAICRPLHSRQWQTLKHSYKTLAVCWIAAIFVSIPVAIYTKYTPLRIGNSVCRERWGQYSLHLGYTVLLDVILLVLPVGIMSFSYGKISYTLWIGMKLDSQEMEYQNGNGQMYKPEVKIVSSKDGFGRTIGPSELQDLNKSRKSSSKMRFNARGIRQTNNEKSRAAKQRVIKMLFAIVLEFFICWTPSFIVQTWITIDYIHANNTISVFAHKAIFLLTYVSTCCNPITYCFLNKNFRNGFKSALRRWKCRSGVRSRHETPSYFHYSTGRTNVSNVSAYDKVNCNDESDEL